VTRTRATFVAALSLSIVFIGTLPIAKAQMGIASIYSGGKTANGEVAKANDLTAAHKTLPFGTLVRVTHQHNGRSVVVRINDRGPFVEGRIIDLLPAAARVLGFSGLAPVTVDVISGRS
jgi:rare lipoprotein A